MNDEPTQLPDSENPHAAEFAVLEAFKAEVESLKDQRLRALAEAENIRRRAEREKTEASQYAVTKFARDMVGIADNFARALAAVPAQVREAADPAVKAVLDGVEATDRQLVQTLERYGVKPVATDGILMRRRKMRSGRRSKPPASHSRGTAVSASAMGMRSCAITRSGAS